MFRRALIVLLGGVTMSTIVGAQPAFADKPTIEYFTEPVTIPLPAGEFCANFDVTVQIEQNAKVITFSEESGGAIGGIGTGQIFATVTNEATGESIRLAISGPGFFDRSGALVSGTGQWLLFIPGEPGQILYLVGQFTFNQEDYGVSPDVVRGQQVDLCTVL